MSAELVRYFQSHMTVVDWAIICLGLLVMLMQAGVRLSTSRRRFLAHARRDPLVAHRAEIKLEIISTLIELLPYLGILGTVMGLMQALFVIQRMADPTIAVIAAKMAPALSTTFEGLVFAILNLFAFNFLAAYFHELIAESRLEEPPEARLEPAPQAQGSPARRGP